MSQSYWPHARNLGWFSILVGWFAAQLILEDTVGLLWEKKKLLKKIIGIVFIARVEGKVGGRYAGSSRNA